MCTREGRANSENGAPPFFPAKFLPRAVCKFCWFSSLKRMLSMGFVPSDVMIIIVHEHFPAAFDDFKTGTRRYRNNPPHPKQKPRELKKSRLICECYEAMLAARN